MPLRGRPLGLDPGRGGAEPLIREAWPFRALGRSRTPRLAQPRITAAGSLKGCSSDVLSTPCCFEPGNPQNLLRTSDLMRTLVPWRAFGDLEKCRQLIPEHEAALVGEIEAERQTAIKDIQKLPVRFPKRSEEQKAIIDFIRQADDAAGAAQRKFAAAQRLKTALMQQLFTRGIPGRHTSWKPLIK